MAKRKDPKRKPRSQRADRAPQMSPLNQEMEAVRKATEVVVSMLKLSGMDAASIREEAMDAVKGSFTIQDRSQLMRTYPIRTAHGVEATECVSAPGIFRFVLDNHGFDHRPDAPPDVYREETYVAVVSRTLDELLSV